MWISLATMVSRSINIISAIILSRILLPEDFGLMAMATSIIAFSQGTTQAGTESALIQKGGTIDDYLNSAWIIELARHLVLFCTIFVLAPFLSRYFNDDRLLVIIRVISFSFIFYGIKNIGVIHFRKSLDFKKQFIFEIIPLVIYVVVVIGLAYYLRNVWALVIANMLNSIIICSLSYIIHPFRPKYTFSAKHAKKLLHFGKWIFVGSLLNMLREQGTNMFIGKSFGISTLGHYSRATTFSTIIFQQITAILWKVGYPAFSLIQDDTDKIRTAYLRSLTVLALISMPIAGGMYLMSSDFVRLFLSKLWEPIVPLLKINSIIGAIAFVGAPSAMVFQAKGKPRIPTVIGIITTFIIIGGIYPASQIYGISGVLYVFLLGALISVSTMSIIIIKELNLRLLQLLGPLMGSIIMTSIMLSILSYIKDGIIGSISHSQFILLIIIGVIIYTILLLIYEKVFGLNIKSIIKSFTQTRN